jgi:hypothetical protein
MKAEVKELWVAALRSGEYKQGVSYLKRQDGCYCCLGVLCELAVKAGVIQPPQLTRCTWTYADKSFYVPETVQEWAGLSSDFGDPITIQSATETPACHNDNGMAFASIADAIEREL